MYNKNNFHAEGAFLRFDKMNHAELTAERNKYAAALEKYITAKRALNMARGRPEAAQLALSNGLLDCVSQNDFISEDGTDCRNYLGLDGLFEMKRLFAEIFGTSPERVIVGGNSSLNMMFDCIQTFLYKLWRAPVKFICPVPGYDRHFTVCEYLNIEMATVPMTHDGPDADAVERLAADPAYAGMWCVPVFSNPQGYVYSDETVKRLASMKTANENFRLIWDDAYAVHHFRGEPPEVKNIIDACAERGNQDRPVVFTSFSKISFAGGGVAALAASEKNLRIFRERLTAQTVGPDKLNQLRHARFFKNLSGIRSHMNKHAEILRPKFDLVNKIFAERLEPTGAAEWTKPDGGYFISVETQNGCAKRVVALCADAGLEVTGAGATYPYKNDPNDSNIRIAPSSLSLVELETALGIFCLAANLAAAEKLIHGENYA